MKLLTCQEHYARMEGLYMMLDVTKVVEGLQRELKNRWNLKRKFNKKFASISHDIRKTHNYEEMQLALEYCSEEEFIRRAGLLGFNRNKETYKSFPKRRGEVSVYDQAADYVECFFNFNDFYFEMVKESEEIGVNRNHYYVYLKQLAE